MVEAGGYPAGCAGREAVPGVSVREGFPAVLLAAFIARRWPGARALFCQSSRPAACRAVPSGFPAAAVCMRSSQPARRTLAL